MTPLLFGLRGDIVDMLTYTYPLKPLRKINVTTRSHQADSQLYVWPDVWSGDLQVQKSMVIHDTYMSLLRPGVIKQHKANFLRVFVGNTLYIILLQGNFTLVSSMTSMCLFGSTWTLWSPATLEHCDLAHYIKLWNLSYTPFGFLFTAWEVNFYVLYGSIKKVLCLFMANCKWGFYVFLP